MQAIRHKRHKDVGFNAGVLLMKNGAYGQIAFEVAKGLFDLGELDVILPQPRRVLAAKI